MPLPEHLNPFRAYAESEEDDDEFEGGDAPRARSSTASGDRPEKPEKGGERAAGAPAAGAGRGRGKMMDIDTKDPLIHDFYDSDEDEAVSAA